MKPEFTAYQWSPHARVACADCHIGPGASWFVKSKLSGVYQVYATVFDKFPPGAADHPLGPVHRRVREGDRVRGHAGTPPAGEGGLGDVTSVRLYRLPQPADPHLPVAGRRCRSRHEHGRDRPAPPVHQEAGGAGADRQVRDQRRRRRRHLPRGPRVLSNALPAGRAVQRRFHRPLRRRDSAHLSPELLPRHEGRLARVPGQRRAHADLGCFRCHDGEHVSSDGRRITHACDACHTIVAGGPSASPAKSLDGLQFQHPVEIGDAWRETSCSSCHDGALVQ
jgi:hypothetical protein